LLTLGFVEQKHARLEGDFLHADRLRIPDS
jgi:hypothetical protein